MPNKKQPRWLGWAKRRYQQQATQHYPQQATYPSTQLAEYDLGYTMPDPQQATQHYQQQATQHYQQQTTQRREIWIMQPHKESGPAMLFRPQKTTYPSTQLEECDLKYTMFDQQQATQRYQQQRALSPADIGLKVDPAIYMAPGYHKEKKERLKYEADGLAKKTYRTHNPPTSNLKDTYAQAASVSDGPFASTRRNRACYVDRNQAALANYDEIRAQEALAAERTEAAILDRADRVNKAIAPLYNNHKDAYIKNIMERQCKAAESWQGPQPSGL